MAEELPVRHDIELRMKREVLHQLRTLKKSPAWVHLTKHIEKGNKDRQEFLLRPAYTTEAQQEQNYQKGIIMGTQLFTGGIDLLINDYSNDIALLEKKVEDEHETD